MQRIYFGPHVLSRLLGAVSLCFAPAFGTPAGGADGGFSREGMIADYHAEMREQNPRADGVRHFDTPALIEKLKELHVTAFFFLIHSQPSDWDDFKEEFVPAAQRVGIDAWAYLVPPSECCAMPFGNDYVRWATELATLSTRYPNLKGFAIDDFEYNLKLYTPEYIGNMVRAAKAVNPQFRFFPQVYWRVSTNPSFLDSYAPVIDGLIMAYRDDPHTNTYRSTSFEEQIGKTEEMLAARHLALVLMVYCNPLGRNPVPPPAAYIGKLVRAGLEDMREGKLFGVVTYVLDKGGQPAPPSLNRAHSGSGRATFLIAGPILVEGKSGEISRTISVDPNAAAYAVSFWHTHSATRAPQGVYSAQVLLDDRVVWEEDVAAGPPDQWRREHVEIGSALKGMNTATLRFRVTNKRRVTSLDMNLGFDDIGAEGFRLENPGFESDAGWTAKATDPAILPLTDIFDPLRPIRSFATVRDLYGPYALVQRAAQSCPQGRVNADADAFLRVWRAGDFLRAAGLANSLAKAAAKGRCTVLADQAQRVAADLRGIQSR